MKKNNNKRDLLFSVTKKDLTIEWFCASGPGGQKRNRSKSACRIKHPDSGAMGMCKEHKSPQQNKKEAFVRMTKSGKFKLWHNRKVQEITDKETVEQKVNKMMRPENLIIEVVDKESKKWIKENK